MGFWRIVGLSGLVMLGSGCARPSTEAAVSSEAERRVTSEAGSGDSAGSGVSSEVEVRVAAGSGVGGEPSSAEGSGDGSAWEVVRVELFYLEKIAMRPGAEGEVTIDAGAGTPVLARVREPIAAAIPVPMEVRLPRSAREGGRTLRVVGRIHYGPAVAWESSGEDRVSEAGAEAPLRVRLRQAQPSP